MTCWHFDNNSLSERVSCFCSVAAPTSPFFLGSPPALLFQCDWIIYVMLFELFDSHTEKPSISKFSSSFLHTQRERERECSFDISNSVDIFKFKCYIFYSGDCGGGGSLCHWLFHRTFKWTHYFINPIVLALLLNEKSRLATFQHVKLCYGLERVKQNFNN